ncbi:DNA methylase [Mesorhizobium sp. LNHC221B00]|uniref:DNA-methyltransferase n=1 Tax=Mesorhizobium sp. LNHC221B00 TaxID=1287233 RepID=UPI0003CF1B34|nr:DNA methyltransferase [Mesorhizobium sp. LNHC221B00]ESY72080.1 DNA methylase [Mesorhizobium sp. LNHC221B00]
MKKLPAIKAVDQDVTDRYAIYQGDSCELIRAVPGDSVQFGVHSPPFEGLYKFSGSDRDLSNSEGKTFWQHYQFLISEMLRITMPGRIQAVHVMQLPTSKRRDGFIGMRDFRGEVIRAWQDAGWHFHSEVCIWKDAVVAQARSKSHRLNHKQVVKDSTISGQALADYIVAFRKPGDNPEPVAGALKRYVGEGAGPDYAKFTTDNDSRNWFSIEVWQRYASPVWMDIRQSRTLQYLTAKDAGDEAHIAPLQLDVIERCIDLWSNPGDIVFTPFLGIGSEVWAAVQSGRRGLGFELKDKYFRQARINMTRETSAVSADALAGLERGTGPEAASDAPLHDDEAVDDLEAVS